MNEMNVYEDSYRADFARQEDFMAFIKRIMRSSSWDKRKTKDLRLFAMTGEGSIMDAVKKQYADMGLDEEIVTDTAKNTGLVLRVKKQLYPVRECAIRTILDRACISGSALRKVDRNVYAKILNHCLKVANGEALIRISEGKVSAVLGGDSHDYAVLDMEQIFSRAVEYLTHRFSGCTYLGGFYEHDMASSLWELSGEDSLLDAYREELRLAGKTPEEMKPVVRISTSDTGQSGANIYPMLLSGDHCDTIPLGKPLRLEHKAGATIKMFENQLDLLYGKYQVAISQLTNLLSIDIQNPVNCMQGVMKKLGIPKRLGMEAVELFKAQYGEDPCTAHEIYYGISEILYMMACNGEGGSRITMMEEMVARAFSIRWQEYDVPGVSVW